MDKKDYGEQIDRDEKSKKDIQVIYFGMGGKRKGTRKWSNGGSPLTGDQREAFKNKWKEYCKSSSFEDRTQ